MKKVSVYIRSLNVSPSGYYRIVQYTNKLDVIVKIHNILPPSYYYWYLNNQKFQFLCDVMTYMFMYLRVICFFIQDILYERNVFILSRGLLPRHFVYPLKNILLRMARKGSIYWDFDDDILLSKEISACEFKMLSEISSAIVVTHEYLKEKVEQRYWNKVIVMPTTDGDFHLMKFDEKVNERISKLENEINLVWVGSAVNLIHLEQILKPLDYCAEKLYYSYNKKLNLYICSSRNVEFESKFLNIKNKKWSKNSAIQIISNSHIGLMPLIDTEYAQGKGGFKLIQYMAAGLPVISSNVGFNKSIVKDNFGRLIQDITDSESWLNALLQLSLDTITYRKFSCNSLQEWKNNYSYMNNLKIWSSLLESSIKFSVNK
ncbi:MAG: hypothetical protein BACD_04213 [Bacteroides rodentium]